MTAIPASATSRATETCTSGSCMPKVTQWLAVTGCSNPVSTTWRARSRSVSTAGSSISSTCRSRPIPASVATAREWAINPGPSGSRCGQPPIRSTPTSIAASSASRLTRPSGPVIGFEGSATT